MKTAQIEPIAGILRVWGDDKKHGEPYKLSATIRWINQDTVELLGLTTPVDREAWIAIAEVCCENGIKKVLATRYRNGKKQEHWIDVVKWYNKANRTP